MVDHHRRGLVAVGLASLLVALLAVVQTATGGWSRQAVPDLHGGLAGVSCASADACTAVGTSDKGRHLQRAVTLAERWNGHRWSVQRTPDPRSTPDSNLVGVSCPSATSCMAVGETNTTNGSHYVPFTERWNAGRWSIQSTPHGNNWYLYGVSCSLSTACIAVGSYLDRTVHRNLTLAERWNGRRWAVLRTRNPAGAHASSLQAVSCSSAMACTAVGYTNFGEGNNNVLLAERWNGHRWSIQRTPRPSHTESLLLAVSCSSATACTAVGYEVKGRLGSHGLTLAERWNGHRWSLQSAPSTGFDILHAVACSSARACAAVGEDATGFDASASLSERWNGHRWSIQRTPHPTGVSLLEGVSCTAAKSCIAVGSSGDPRIGQTRPLVERYS